MAGKEKFNIIEEAERITREVEKPYTVTVPLGFISLFDQKLRQDGFLEELYPLIPTDEELIEAAGEVGEEDETVRLLSAVRKLREHAPLDATTGNLVSSFDPAQPINCDLLERDMDALNGFLMGTISGDIGESADFLASGNTSSRYGLEWSEEGISTHKSDLQLFVGLNRAFTAAGAAPRPDYMAFFDGI